jgi:hypothetical protein
LESPDYKILSDDIKRLNALLSLFKTNNTLYTNMCLLILNREIVFIKKMELFETLINSPENDELDYQVMLRMNKIDDTLAKIENIYTDFCVKIDEVKHASMPLLQQSNLH